MFFDHIFQSVRHPRGNNNIKNNNIVKILHIDAVQNRIRAGSIIEREFLLSYTHHESHHEPYLNCNLIYYAHMRFRVKAFLLLFFVTMKPTASSELMNFKWVQLFKKCVGGKKIILHEESWQSLLITLITSPPPSFSKKSSLSSCDP